MNTLENTRDPLTWRGFGAFSVTAALEPSQKALAAGWLEAEHFLGSFKPVGHSLIHLVSEDDQLVAVVQWAACSYHLKDREEWIGWDKLTCARRRNLIVNNVRFLVREASRRPNLASKALAHSVRALPAHWCEHFGYEPLLCETFTDLELHEGTCYKAAGWTPLGLTAGHSRHRADFYVANGRPKKLWIKPLRADARERLCAPDLAPAHAAGQRMGKGAPLPLKAVQMRPLALALRSVPDPRAKNRTQPLGPLLCLLALGLLCGGTNLNAVLRHARRLTQAQLRTLGLRGHKAQPEGRVLLYRVPDYETFRQILIRLDLDAFAQVLSQWLSEHRGALPANLSLDGKRIRGTLGTIVTLCDNEQKLPVAVAATTAPGGEQACARRLLREEQTILLNATVSLDALYANDENARLIVQEKGGDYLISVKDNQPGLDKRLRQKLKDAPFLNSPRSAATGS